MLPRRPSGATGRGAGAGLIITFLLLVLLIPREDRLPQRLGLGSRLLQQAGARFLWRPALTFGLLLFLVSAGREEGRPLLLFPLEPSEEVTEPSGPPESEGGERTSSLVASCFRVGSSEPLRAGRLGDLDVSSLPWDGVEGALRDREAPTAVSISCILLSCLAMASLSAWLFTDLSLALMRSSASSLASGETKGRPLF